MVDGKESPMPVLHFHDVESERYPRLADGAQIAFCGADDIALLVTPDGVGGTVSILPAACLDLYKAEFVIVAHDDVNFAMAVPVVACKILHATLFEHIPCKPFADSPKPFPSGGDSCESASPPE